MAQVAARIGGAVVQELPLLVIAGIVLIGVPAAAYSGSYPDCADIKEGPEKETCEKTKVRGPDEIWIPILMIVVPILIKFLWAVIVQHSPKNREMQLFATDRIGRAMGPSNGLLSDIIRNVEQQQQQQ